MLSLDFGHEVSFTNIFHYNRINTKLNIELPTLNIVELILWPKTLIIWLKRSTNDKTIFCKKTSVLRTDLGNKCHLTINVIFSK